MPLNQALDEFIKNQLQVGGRDYHATYTAFHYGEDTHLWLYSHYEGYEPTQPSAPALVILRYRPASQE